MHMRMFAAMSARPTAGAQHVYAKHRSTQYSMALQNSAFTAADFGCCFRALAWHLCEVHHNKAHYMEALVLQTSRLQHSACILSS
jgi:hypothetical protein